MTQLFNERFFQNVRVETDEADIKEFYEQEPVYISHLESTSTEDYEQIYQQFIDSDLYQTYRQQVDSLIDNLRSILTPDQTDNQPTNNKETFENEIDKFHKRLLLQEDTPKIAYMVANGIKGATENICLELKANPSQNNCQIAREMIQNGDINLCANGAFTNLNDCLAKLKNLQGESLLTEARNMLAKQLAVNSVSKNNNNTAYEIHTVNASINYIAEDFGLNNRPDTLAPDQCTTAQLEKFKASFKAAVHSHRYIECLAEAVQWQAPIDENSVKKDYDQLTNILNSIGEDHYSKSIGDIHEIISLDMNDNGDMVVEWDNNALQFTLFRRLLNSGYIHYQHLQNEQYDLYLLKDYVEYSYFIDKQGTQKPTYIKDLLVKDDNFNNSDSPSPHNKLKQWNELLQLMHNEFDSLFELKTRNRQDLFDFQFVKNNSLIKEINRNQSSFFINEQAGYSAQEFYRRCLVAALIYNDNELINNIAAQLYSYRNGISCRIKTGVLKDKTVLIVALRLNRIKALRQLIHPYGADWRVVSKSNDITYNATVLDLAVKYGNTEAFNAIIDAAQPSSTEINAPDEYWHWNVLHRAAFHGSKDILSVLIKRFDVDINKRVVSQDESTPLLLAVSSNKAETVKTLLAYGADTQTDHKKGSFVYKPLHLATVKRYESIVSALLQNSQQARNNIDAFSGSSSDSISDSIEYSNRNALQLAVADGKQSSNIAKILLDHGADAFKAYQIPKLQNLTPFHYAAIVDHRLLSHFLNRENVRQRIDEQCSIKALHNMQMSALQLAVYKKADGAIHTLLNYNADPLQVIGGSGPMAGYNALHIAASEGNLLTIWILLSNRNVYQAIDRYYYDANGEPQKNALHLAIDKAPHIVEWLLMYGANPNLYAKAGLDSLHPIEMAQYHYPDSTHIINSLLKRLQGNENGSLTIRQNGNPITLWSNRTKLHEAIYQGNESEAIDLIDNTDISETINRLTIIDDNEAYDAETVLHSAISRNQPDVVEKLLANGANIKQLSLKNDKPYDKLDVQNISDANDYDRAQQCLMHVLDKAINDTKDDSVAYDICERILPELFKQKPEITNARLNPELAYNYLRYGGDITYIVSLESQADESETNLSACIELYRLLVSETPQYEKARKIIANNQTMTLSFKIDQTPLQNYLNQLKQQSQSSNDELSRLITEIFKHPGVNRDLEDEEGNNKRKLSNSPLAEYSFMQSSSSRQSKHTQDQDANRNRPNQSYRVCTGA